jgi:hypothetical protein
MIDHSTSTELRIDHSISMNLRIDGLIRLIATEHGDHMFTAQQTFGSCRFPRKQTERKKKKQKKVVLIDAKEEHKMCVRLGKTQTKIETPKTLIPQQS